jgi:cytosine/adenosine deaminase-related metal-dependent hydrolase
MSTVNSNYREFTMIERTRVDLIISGGTVLTMDDADRVIDDGAVAIVGNAIVAVGPRAELLARFDAARTLDAQHRAILPGLIDTYGHAGHGLAKGLYHPDLPWPSGPLYFHATDEAWWYAEGMLSNLERLRFGVTCGFTVVGATPARMDSPACAERQAEAVRNIGIRGVLGIGPPDPYVSHLPEPWSGTFWEGDQPTTRTFTYDDTLAHCEEVIRTWHNGADGRVQIALHFPYLFGRQAAHPRIPFVYRDEYVPTMLMRAHEIRALARQHQLLLHTHAFRGSLSYGLEKFGESTVRDLLGPDVALAHCNGLAADEIRILGETASSICVVPFTHENILYDPCPVIELLQAGANVTISTDGTAAYSSYDLLQEVSRAMWTQWMRFRDQHVLPAGKALRMVTIDAARALRLDHLIGSLEVGKRADIVLINLAQPHFTPQNLLPWQLALYANGHDVETVLVDGKILKEGSRVTHLDEEAILDDARTQAERAFRRMSISGMAISRYLTMSKAFWRGWRYDDPA